MLNEKRESAMSQNSNNAVFHQNAGRNTSQGHFDKVHVKTIESPNQSSSTHVRNPRNLVANSAAAMINYKKHRRSQSTMAGDHSISKPASKFIRKVPMPKI